MQLFFLLLMSTWFSIFPVSNTNTFSVPTENDATADSVPKTRQNVRIVFYNVENFYDPYDDSTTLDDDFTPSGIKHWNYGKFRIKVNHLARTLIAISEWNVLAFVGLCEVENKYVLNKLIYDSPLKNSGYKIIHHDSPDARGVDVAAIYHPDLMKVCSYKYFSIRYPFDTLAQTREILHVKALILPSDTIHFFVNHWPSRRGGQAESNPRRWFVAGVLRSLIDSVLTANGEARIMIMGDLNDEPWNESVEKGLRAGNDTAVIVSFGLYNLMGIRKWGMNDGTLKYRGEWSLFDQIIVSGNLLSKTDLPVIASPGAHVFRGSFLMQDDPVYLGKKLRRTYTGPRYSGGFSDHLPVYADLVLRR